MRLGLQKYQKVLIGVGAGLLIISILINIWGVGKVNYFKKENARIVQERKALEEVADSIVRVNILLDESITNKEEAFKRLEDEKPKIRTRVDSLEYDDIIRELSEYYFRTGDDTDPENGTHTPDQGE